MKIIINENQLRVIVENEEYINSIKELINTFDPNNIEMAFQIMEGLKIKPSIILEDYMELFDIFGLKPSKLNLIKMSNRKEVYVENRSSVPDILFKMSNLEGITIIGVNNLGNLTSFNGDLEIKTKGIIPNLTYVGGNLYLDNSQIESLPKLESVGENLDLKNTPIKDLGNLKSVGGYLDLDNSQIESLPKLESVGEDLYLSHTQIESLGNLKSVGGDLDLIYSQIETLGNLESVGGYLDLYNTPIKDLGNLKSVGGSLDLKNTPIESLGGLKYVGRDLYLKNTPLSDTTTEEELRNKIEVKGNVYL